MAYDPNDPDVKYLDPGVKGESPDCPWDEIAQWGRPEDQRGYQPYWCTPTTIAKWAKVQRSTVYSWLGSDGCPQQNTDGLIDAHKLYWWKRDRDQARQRKPAGKGCVP